MAQYTVTAGGHTVSVTVTDPAQLAALEAEYVRHNLTIPDSEDLPRGLHDDYCAGPDEYLNWAMRSWAEGNPGATEQDVRDTINRALASYANQNPPEVLVSEPEPTVASLLAYAAHKRWQVEVSGATWNGHGVRTDRESQTKMLAAYVQLGGGLRADPSPWKLADGYVNATNAQMAEIITAALTHVQTAFAVEAALDAGIKSDPPTVTTKAAIDAAFNAVV